MRKNVGNIHDQVSLVCSVCLFAGTDGCSGHLVLRIFRHHLRAACDHRHSEHLSLLQATVSSIARNISAKVQFSYFSLRCDKKIRLWILFRFSTTLAAWL